MTAPSSTESWFTVGLAPELTSISVARSIVRRMIVFVSDDAASSYLVALTEVLSNAIDEHHGAGVVDDVVMTVVFGDVDRISITDRGRGVDPTGRSDPEMDTHPESGRGLTLARAFVAGLVLESTTHGTRATLPLAGMGIVK